MPVYDLSSGLRGLDNGIDSLGASLQGANKQQLLQTLGAQLQSGDYDGAAATAFKTGDINTGLAIQKMKQQQQAGAQLAGAMQGPAAAPNAASAQPSNGGEGEGRDGMSGSDGRSAHSAQTLMPRRSPRSRAAAATRRSAPRPRAAIGPMANIR